MKCLLVSYTGLGYNSTEHAAAFACGLARAGWSVRLATAPVDPYLSDFSFFACGADGSLQLLAPDAPLEPADVVHVWTPRAPIWRFLEAHGRLVGGALVLHFEDDEDEVLALLSDSGVRTGSPVTRATLRAHRLEDWTHPDLTRCLAHAADAITVLSPELAANVPATTLWRHVIPPLGPAWCGPVSAGDLPPDFTDQSSIIYAGGIHQAVAGDFFQLCTAVGRLNEAGRRVELVRCGPPVCPEFIAEANKLAGAFRDLGHLPIAGLRAVMAHATLLAQPGGPTNFNRRRFPSKLAPYLASGSPVVMPACYAWTGVQPDVHAITFARGTADDIAAAITRVLDKPDDARRMAGRAAEFAREHFDLDACGAALDRFYRELPATPRIPWFQVRKPRVELPLWFAEAARAHRGWWPWRRPRPVELPSTLAGAAGSREFVRSLPPPERLVRVAIEEVRQPALAPGQSVSVAQFYWPTENGFAEPDSVATAFLSGRWRRLVFGPRTIGVGRRPRLDPGNRPGLYEIAAVTYRTADGAVVERLRGAAAFEAHGTITPLVSPSGRLARWLSTGGDPQLMLRAPHSADVDGVECWIRWTPL